MNKDQDWDSEPDVIPMDGEDMIFLVKSWSTPWIRYRVDLRAYNYHGACSCDHFQFRCDPRLRRKQRGRHLMCKHVECAKIAGWDYLGPKFDAYVQQQKPKSVVPSSRQVPPLFTKPKPRIYQLHR